MADPESLTFLADGSELSGRIAALDWSATAVGPLQSWSASLRATVGLMLRSPVSMVLLWGEPGCMIYNDAFIAFAGGRHPSGLGLPVREVWPEVADFNNNVLRTCLAGGTLAYHDQELTFFRNGVEEKAWQNLYYSPVLDDSGLPGGVIAVVVETTRKVLADRYLAAEVERLRAMYEQAPGFTAVFREPDHRLELTNAAYRRLIGDREVLGLLVRDALPELEHQGFFEQLDEVYATGVPHIGTAVPVELARLAGGGLEQRFLDFIFQPIRGPEGAITGIFVQGQDVTERVAAEQELRASEARFRGFAQAMPNQVWTATPDGMLDWFNDRALAELRVTAEELVGDRWTTHVHPEDLPAAATRWGVSLKSGLPYEVQFRLGDDRKGWRWHIARASPIRDGQGDITRWIGTNTDIEDQKAAEAALGQLNATLNEQVAARTADLDRMWRLSTDLMVVNDFDTMISAVNPAWTRILGWQPSALVGRRVVDFMHPDDVAASSREARRLEHGGSLQQFECRIRTQAGGWRTISWTAASEDGFIHGVGRDVTDDRAAARALAESQAALQQAQKMETVGKLTGGVAHDFNNLLQVISGNLELLAERAAEDSQSRTLISQAMDAVGRGGRLASQLLSYARRQPLAPKVVNPGRLIRNMDDMLRRTLGETVEVEIVIAGGLWNSMVDPVQIETALLNLAINARDAMPAGGRLTIEAGNASLDDSYVRQHEELRRGQYVMIAVTDTGTGMAAAVIEQAFEPFFSTKPEGQGTGLGLSMVYGFVKQSEGHVVIYSEIGHGTTVKMYLPRSTLTEDVEIRRAEGPVLGGRETILVAEDDAEVLGTVVALLTGLGYRVLTARDAASALVVIESGANIDLLFTDVVMPGAMRSPELARRARERSPNIAVLFTSGYTANAIVHGGRLDEGVELLSKPYGRDALARRVRSVLDEAAKRRAPRPAGRRVLLVEDDPIIRMGSISLLKRLGHVVVPAAHAEQALQLIGTEPAFDVLFTDIGLPGMRGDALARRVRESFPTMPVIFATGYNDAPELSEPVAYVAKPFGRTEVERALAAVLG